MGDYSEKSYRKKLETIFTRFPSVQQLGFGEAYKPGLEHMQEFENLLGEPHKAYRTLHVAGTNGKGSVASMLASVLSSAGLKTGLYTSPHLVDFRERMRICPVGPGGAPGVLVPEEYVYNFLCRHEAAMDRMNLSFFEITTGMAFRWFADEKVDVAVIETGLGGRLDSTNIILPDLSIVTTIGLDHCEQLGNTLEAIAGEKAGIFKKGVPALVGEAVPETRPVFEAKASGLCPVVFAQDSAPSLWPRHEEILRKMDLQGGYQRRNLRTVLVAVDLLKGMPFYAGLQDDAGVADAIARAAARTGFHGRWERLCEDPPVLCDIGHNPQALQENFGQLRKMLSDGECSSLLIVYAVMADKDLDAILPLMPEEATYLFTSPAIPRALPADRLAARYKAFCRKTGRSDGRARCTASVRDAVDMAVRLAQRRGPHALVYIGGSAYLVAEAVTCLQGF